MSDLHEQESEFARFARQAPLEDAPRAEHRALLAQRVLAEFDASPKVVPEVPAWKRILTQGREIMRRPTTRFATAGALLAGLVVWLLVVGHDTPAQAFHKLAEAVLGAKSARYQMEIKIDGQPSQQCVSYYLSPGKYRQEFPGFVNVMDMSAMKVVSLNTAAKQATVMNFKNAEENDRQDNFEKLRQLLSKMGDAKENAKYKPLGEKMIDGKLATGFQLDSTEGVLTLWGDPTSGRPIRIDGSWNSLMPASWVMSDFEINVELKDSLFEMTPPDDYKVQAFDVDASKLSEADLINALRTTCELREGTFLDKLDTSSLTKALGESFQDRKEKPSDEELKQLVHKSVEIGRGIGFAGQLPESADAHYAGSGVKLNADNRPVFWYKPEGKKYYRVIYADLSVKDADQAPEIEGAQRIEAPGKSPAAK